MEYPVQNNFEPRYSWLLDTEAWRGYINSEIADWAIGGPSIPLVILSYNQTVRAHPELGLKEVTYQCISTKEYRVDPFRAGTLNSQAKFAEIFSVGYKASTQSMSKYLTASFDTWDKPILAKTNGEIDFSTMVRGPHYPGVRPVVRLSSNVELVLGENGIVEIINK